MNLTEVFDKIRVHLKKKLKFKNHFINTFLSYLIIPTLFLILENQFFIFTTPTIQLRTSHFRGIFITIKLSQLLRTTEVNRSVVEMLLSIS